MEANAKLGLLTFIFFVKLLLFLFCCCIKDNERRTHAEREREQRQQQQQNETDVILCMIHSETGRQQEQPGQNDRELSPPSYEEATSR